MARANRPWRPSSRRWRVRTKLAAAMLIPSVAFVAVGGAELTSRLAAGRAMGILAERVALGREVSSVVHPLQDERDRLAGVLGAVPGGAEQDAVATTQALPATQALRAALRRDRRAVDDAASAYRSAAASLVPRLGGNAAVRMELAGHALDGLAHLRTSADEGRLPQEAVFDAYTRVIAALSAVLPDSAGAGEDAVVEQRLRGLRDLMRVAEAQSQVRGHLTAAARSGGLTTGWHQQVTDVRARRSVALGEFRAGADAASLARYEQIVRNTPADPAAQLLPGAALDAGQWWRAGTDHLDVLRSVELEILDSAADLTARRSDEAADRAHLTALGFVLVICATLAVMLVIARSMTASLRRLDDRHRAALQLAGEQARLREDTCAMFVSLARRGQALVARQLRLIDEMEAAEQDPDRLAQLFELDHLTTRLRRNDENLLVLAAQESSRIRREPAQLSQVLLGAVAETAQYQRVQLAGPEDILMPGHVVPDVLHVLAELLDNATAFSAPSTTVTVHTELAEDGSVEVTIRDAGVGMTESMLTAANAELAAPAPVDVSFADRMGLFVVSHLAARQGMRVELSHATAGGVQAVLQIPAATLAFEGGAAAPPSQPAPSQPAPPSAAVATVADNPGPASGRTPDTDRTTGWWLATPGPTADWLATTDRFTADGFATEPGAPRTGGTTAAGLPVRVPTAGSGRGAPAHPVPAENDRAQAPDAAPIPAEMPAPADVGTMLARFHSGVRRADDEELAERPSSPRRA